MERQLEKAFLLELEALEKFRISYTGMYPNVPLAREDPDVRRLLEAMAFFTARTRLAAERNLSESLLRILRQHYPYLLRPVPAMVMLRAGITRRYVDITTVPVGTEVNLTSAGGTEPAQTFCFRTLAPLRILPIEIEGLETLRVGSRGYRILVRFSAPFPRNESIGELDLHVDYLNDLHSSLLVLHELRSHLRATSVVWNHDATETTHGEPCVVEFGAPKLQTDDLDAFEHPLQRARAALHFPQQELYLRVKNLHSPRGWHRFTLCFDFDEHWPKTLRLNLECFQLHVVPMANVTKAMARAIEYDGTKDHHLAVHPDRGGHFVPLSVHAAYRSAATGLLPLDPASIEPARNSFEGVVSGKGQERKALISLRIPEAFDHPETVLVDAYWHQPRVQSFRAADLKAQLASRFVDGIDWSCFGPLVGHADSDLDDDREGVLQLLSIRGQRLLGLHETRFLLRALGWHKARPFAKLLTQLGAVRIVDKPHTKHSSGFKHVYELTFDDLTLSDIPRLDLFCSKLLEVLSVWSIDEVIELVALVPNLEKKLRFS